MRRQVWITGGIILMICGGLLLWSKITREAAQHGDSLSVVTNSIEVPVSTTTTTAPQSKPIHTTPSSSASLQTPSTIGSESNAYRDRILSEWQAPIEFYGRVVDENNRPISGASVRFSWVETPEESGEEEWITESDSNGLFSLTGKRGPTLGVNVSKQGYYTSRSTPDSFHFALGHEKFSPDPLNPVIFHLRKKSQPAQSLITSENGIRANVAVRIPKNNTPVRVDLFQKEASTGGQMEISQNKPPWREATEWSFRITIPNGGLVENTDEFQFEAPEANYQSTVECHFTKSETNWITHVAKQYYIAVGQPRQYGWFRIESDLAQETVFLTYAINPTGSRNLEPQ